MPNPGCSPAGVGGCASLVRRREETNGPTAFSHPPPSAQQKQRIQSAYPKSPASQKLVFFPEAGPWSAAHKLCLSTGCAPEARQGTKQSLALRSVPEVTRRASNPHPSLDRGGNWSSERERACLRSHSKTTANQHSNPSLPPQEHRTVVTPASLW